MPFKLWGATRAVGLTPPDHLPGYSLLAVYTLLVVLILAYRRADLRNMTRRQWGGTAVLVAISFLVGQLFPIQFPFGNQLATAGVPPDPVETLTLFAAAPFLLAGIVLNPAAAMAVGLVAGLARALGQTHSPYDIFHFAFAAFSASLWMRQRYLGRVYDWLRQPAVSGGLAMSGVTLLVALSAFVGTDTGLSAAAALDLALTKASAGFWPLLIEGTLGGGVVSLLLVGLPTLRPSQALVPAPQQLSLRKRLLSNYLLFAALLFVLLFAVVFNTSVSMSTRLVVNQMAHNATAVSEQVAGFNEHLQRLVAQYNDSGALLAEGDAAEKTMRQLYRANRTMYGSILLVDDNGGISVHSSSLGEEGMALTEAEQQKVARALSTSAPDIAAAEMSDDELVVSFVVPVLDEVGQPGAVLVGRLSRSSLDGLVIGLEGVAGQGSGFIVDEDSRIIAHADSGKLRSEWKRPTTQRGMIRTGPNNPGGAYLDRNEVTGARELVYYVDTPDQPWTVVLKAPYAIVLNTAAGIAVPLAGVLVVVMSVFYASLSHVSQDVSRPITALVEASKIIAAGGKWTPPADVSRQDEVGQLNRAFVQMYRSRNKRLNELSLLLDVSREVSTNINIHQGMPAILRGVLRGTGASGARAVIFNPSGSHPLRFGEGPTAQIMSALDRPIMSKLRDSDELKLTTPEQIRRGLGLPPGAELPVLDLIAVALRSHSRFQGVLWLGYRQPHNLDDSAVNLVRTLAGMAAVLVENAHLFARAEGGRRRLAAVLASTSDAVIVTDQTQRVLLINRAAERLFQLKTGDVINRPVADVIHVKRLTDALTGSEEHIHSLEIPVGEDKTYYASISPIISNEGREIGRVAVLHDITPLKEVDRMKSAFVEMLSHDLRTPLTSMRGNVDMLGMMGELNEEQQALTERISHGINRITQLVMNLLDLGRIEAGIGENFESIELEPLLADLAMDHWQHAHLNGIKIKVEVAPDIPSFQGDRALIRQAISNLVNNGIKYAPNSGILMLKAEQVNGELVISVRDRGPGIPREDQVRLFEKFYRAKLPGTERVPGSGLGLAIVKSIAERHGGRVGCRSRRGKGSTFSIVLPLSQNG
ncbi:MAG: ATP-binding protein [Anaerolineae bacterium]